MLPSQNLVYISSSAVGIADPILAIERILPITSNIELTGGGEYDPLLLSRLTAFRQKHAVNLLLHNYFPPPASHFVLNFADCGEVTRNFVSRAAEFVQALGVPYYSVHAGFRGDFRSDRAGMLHRQTGHQYLFDGIRKNADWFRTRWPEIPLALENIYPNNNNTACAFMMSLDEIREALDSIPDIWLLLDLGHLNVSANLMGFDYDNAVAELFSCYGHRILELHLSENNGLVDDHLPVMRGSRQYCTVRDVAGCLCRNGIRVTLEARAASRDLLARSYGDISALLDGAVSDLQEGGCGHQYITPEFAGTREPC